MEDELNRLKNEYKIDIEKTKILKDNVALLVLSNGEKCIFKTKRPKSTKQWIDNHRFYNESRIYKCFATSSFKHLNTPRLLHINNESLLIQYLERCPDRRLADVEVDAFLQSYIELQTINLKGNSWFDKKHQVLRGFFYQCVAVPLFTLRNKIGTRNALKSIFLFLKLNFSHKKLERKYWLHGDLTSNNVFYNKLDQKLYFIDFENLFFTRKWLLAEVIQHCLKVKDNLFYFETDKFKTYLTYASPLIKDMEKINLEQQIRFSALFMITSNLTYTKNKEKRRNLLSFLSIVLDKKKFNNWYMNNVTNLTRKEKPSHICLSSLSCA